MFGVGCFGPETLSIIKIESHPFYSTPLCLISNGMNAKKKSKWPTQKNKIFKIDNSQYFSGLSSRLVGHFEFFFFIPIEIKQKLWDRMDGTQFLWLLWFPAKKNPPQTFLGKWIFEGFRCKLAIKNLFPLQNDLRTYQCDFAKFDFGETIVTNITLIRLFNPHLMNCLNVHRHRLSFYKARLKNLFSLQNDLRI